MARTKFLAGLAVGAGLMYLLDPQQGRRRRALVRDQMVHARHELTDTAAARARHLANRGRGAAIETAKRVAPGADRVDDVTLEERVRAALGRTVSNPGAIHVLADSGRITLMGPVLAREADRLVSRVSAVRGVRELDNRLDVRERAGNVPGLQGTH
ncbi:MAG TPA: BON domain-containing protein [Longimicrobiales bacterium]|nr:BON domain-containing protein [Longimicrobiales bacterium]